MSTDERFFRDLVESANDWMWQINDLGLFLYSSPQVETLLGYAPAELSGKSRFDLMPEAEARRMAHLFAHYARERLPIAGIESENLARDGRRVWLETGAAPWYDAAGVYRGYRGVDRDVTARRLAELRLRETDEALRESHERLHDLSAHMERRREEEKAAIAREIHDELGGTLAALNVDAHWLAEHLPDADAAPRKRVRDMIDLIEGAAGTARRIITELRPAILDDLGLDAAIEWQVDEFRRRSGIDCRLSLAAERKPGRDIALALFRILQESLTNVLRHARPTRVDVELWSEDDTLMLEVSDNGVGMDIAVAESDGHGLRGMKERVRSLGGALEIASRPGRGVTVLARLPADGAAP